jgi:hypothetical protein
MNERNDLQRRDRNRLAVDFDQAPVGNEHFGAGGHRPQLAGDFDLFALGRLAEPLLETTHLLTALLTRLEFRFSFAKSQGEFSAIGCPLVRQSSDRPISREFVVTAAAPRVNAARFLPLRSDHRGKIDTLTSAT